MRLGYRARWLQSLLVAFLVTIPCCNGTTPLKRRWENADLIIEGRIIETKTENGAQVSTIAVDRILKTETIACEPYTKGYVEGLTLQVSANSLSQHLTLRLFLEEDQGAYRIIAADVVEDGQQPSLIDPGSTGLLMLIAMAVAVSQRPVITLDKKE
jgi:hypothetical protein